MPHKDPAVRKAYLAAWVRRPESRRKWAIYIKGRALKKQEALAGRPRPETCEVCGDIPALRGRHAPTPTLYFDHCHRTGRFRGWLCINCNRALGLLKDDPERLLKLAAYLKEHSDG